MMGSTLQDCRLRPIEFEDVDFTLASLARADMRTVDLSGCRFRETNLAEADLRDTVLRSADLRGARTIGLRLEGADLRGAQADPDLWTTAKLAKAKVELMQAVGYAAANGLIVE